MAEWRRILASLVLFPCGLCGLMLMIAPTPKHWPIESRRRVQVAGMLLSASASLLIFLILPRPANPDEAEDDGPDDWEV